MLEVSPVQSRFDLKLLKPSKTYIAKIKPSQINILNAFEFELAGSEYDSEWVGFF